MQTGGTSATVQHWIWLAEQPQTWITAALFAGLVAVVGVILTALVRRRRYALAAAGAGLALLVGVAYALAVTVVKDAFMSGGTAAPLQLSLALLYLTGFKYLQYLAAATALAWLIWRLSARRRV